MKGRPEKRVSGGSTSCFLLGLEVSPKGYSKPHLAGGGRLDPTKEGLWVPLDFCDTRTAGTKVIHTIHAEHFLIIIFVGSEQSLPRAAAPSATHLEDCRRPSEQKRPITTTTRACTIDRRERHAVKTVSVPGPQQAQKVCALQIFQRGLEDLQALY